MKPSTFTFAFYVALVRFVVGQTTPEQANDIAAKAYSDFVRNQLVGAGGIGKNQAIYFTPPNTIGVRAGLVVPPEVTNWDLVPFADNLQDPTETGAQFALTGTESYVNQLLTYLNSVQSAGTPTAAQLSRLSALSDAANNAYTAFQTAQNNAVAQWQADALAQTRHQTFESWIVQKAPGVANAQRAASTAEEAYINLDNQIYGPTAGQRADQINAISTEAQNKLSSDPGMSIPCAEAVNGTIAILEIPSTAGFNLTNITCYQGYNMPTYTGNFNVSLTPWAQASLTSDEQNGVIYAPLYQLPGIVEQCNTWLQGGVKQSQSVVQLDLQKASSSSWSSFGQTTGTKGSGWSVFGIVGSTSSSSSSTSWFNNWGTNFTDDVSIKYTFSGATVPFTVRTGVWDVGDVRDVYPKLTAGSSDPFLNKWRTTKLLLGYRPSVSITVSNKQTWTALTNLVNQQKSAGGGGVNILGINVGSSSKSQSTVGWSSLSMATQGSGGVLTIAPPSNTLTYLLGALATKV